MSCNRTSSRLIEEKHPKLFTPGYSNHVADSLIEDTCKPPALKKTTNDCRFLAVLIKKYNSIKNAHKHATDNKNPKGEMLAL